jgi:hypothetical protein
MNTMLAVALVIPWIFWGLLTGFLIAAGRSWINMLLIPACITVVILATAGLSSIRNAFWISLVLHFILFLFFTGSYVAFLLRKRQ